MSRKQENHVTQVLGKIVDIAHPTPINLIHKGRLLTK